MPVVPGSARADEIEATLKNSVLWNHVERLHLLKNMRVHLTGDEEAENFAKVLEDIGGGILGYETEGVIAPPESVCVKDSNELIDKVFPNLAENHINPNWVSVRAILAPKNDDVDLINAILMSCVTGEGKIYKSIDKVMKDQDATRYPQELLNSLNHPGVPPHKLVLKVNTPAMVLRNLDPPRVCNGTRIQIQSLQANIVVGTILSGEYEGEEVMIPRIPIIPTNIPFEYKRTQFPLRPSFSMTINKSLGQTLKKVGLYLENEVFSHGQFYVGCSQVGSEDCLKIFAPKNKKRNVVYYEALDF